MDVTSYLLGKQAGGGGSSALQNKSVTITENGTTNVTADSGYDGLSKVEVTTNVGGGGGEFFAGTIREAQSYKTLPGWFSMITDLPDIEISANGTTLKNAFLNAPSTFTKLPVVVNTGSVTDFTSMYADTVKASKSISTEALNKSVSKLDTTSGKNFTFMFWDNQELRYLNIPNITLGSDCNISKMFYDCYKIAILDISGMDFSNATTFDTMFSDCGTQCSQTDGAYADGIPYIYVKDATAQNWVLTATNGHPMTWTTDNVIIKQ